MPLADQLLTSPPHVIEFRVFGSVEDEPDLLLDVVGRSRDVVLARDHSQFFEKVGRRVLGQQKASGGRYLEMLRDKIAME